MKLWTHHPSTFRVDDPNLVIDWTTGTFWAIDDPTFRYREALPILQGMVGTNQFLWCCTTRDQFIRTSYEIDLVEWELTVTDTDILAYYQTSTWEDIVWSRGDNWPDLILPSFGEDAGALVRSPLRPGIAACLGPLPVKYSAAISYER